jgi:hypothetical protein
MTGALIITLALCAFLAYLLRRSMRKTDQVRAEMAEAGSLAARRATEDGQKIAEAFALLHDRRARGKDKTWIPWTEARAEWARKAKGAR